MFNKVYFGEQGLTSTSANFIANKSKEVFEGVQKEMESISFVNVTYTVMGEKDPVKVEAGKSLEWLQDTVAMLAKTGRLKALNAWLREAIHAKEEAEAELRNMDLLGFLKLKGEEYKYKPSLKTICEDDIITAMDVAERQKYLELEARAANIGKFIHEDGAFNKARKQIKNQHRKQDVTGVGTPSLTVAQYWSSIPLATIDEIFLKLQEEFRSVQAELNGMKHTIKVKLDLANDEERRKYQLVKNEWDKWYETKTMEMNKYVQDEISKIASMRIIIPQNLEEIYQFVKNS